MWTTTKPAANRAAAVAAAAATGSSSTYKIIIMMEKNVKIKITRDEEKWKKKIPTTIITRHLREKKNAHVTIAYATDKICNVTLSIKLHCCACELKKTTTTKFDTNNRRTHKNKNRREQNLYMCTASEWVRARERSKDEFNVSKCTINILEKHK